MAKKKAPTLPEQLRKLADDIEAATEPKRPMTPEEMMTEFNKKSFKERLQERRERMAAAEDEGDDEGGGNAAAQALRPNRRPRTRVR